MLSHRVGFRDAGSTCWQPQMRAHYFSLPYLQGTVTAVLQVKALGFRDVRSLTWAHTAGEADVEFITLVSQASWGK